MIYSETTEKSDMRNLTPHLRIYYPSPWRSESRQGEAWGKHWQEKNTLKTASRRLQGKGQKGYLNVSGSLQMVSERVITYLEMGILRL